MDLSDLLHVDGVLANLRVNSKKQALQELAARAAGVTGLSDEEIFDTLLQREKLGSTGVGHGIAIPHGKLAGLSQIVGLFARLDKPIEFDAVDGEPVDLVFLLLAPEGSGSDHLKALARIARALRDPAMAQKLRGSQDPAALYALLAAPAAAA